MQTFNVSGVVYRACYLKSLMQNKYFDSSFLSGFDSLPSFLCASGVQFVPNVVSGCQTYSACTRDARGKFSALATQTLTCPTGQLFSRVTQSCQPAANVQC
jgi:hypothetical protein